MAAVYFEKVDVEGHHFGPDSQQVRTTVQQLDVVMQMFNRKVKVTMVRVHIRMDIRLLCPGCFTAVCCCDVPAGNEHGGAAECSDVFRPRHDKDPVDGEGHRAGQVHPHGGHPEDDGPRTGGQFVAQKLQVPGGETAALFSVLDLMLSDFLQGLHSEVVVQYPAGSFRCGVCMFALLPFLFPYL